MAKMIAVKRCYVNDQIHEPGDVFEYDGPEGQGFHEVQGKPLPVVDPIEKMTRTEREEKTAKGKKKE